MTLSLLVDHLAADTKRVRRTLREIGGLKVVENFSDAVDSLQDPDYDLICVTPYFDAPGGSGYGGLDLIDQIKTPGHPHFNTPVVALLVDGFVDEDVARDRVKDYSHVHLLNVHSPDKRSVLGYQKVLLAYLTNSE
jgi:hypothetical protein